MKQTTIYFDEELVKQIAAAARLHGEPKAEVIRNAVRLGLRKKYFNKPTSAQALVELEAIVDDPDLPTSENYETKLYG